MIPTDSATTNPHIVKLLKKNVIYLATQHCKAVDEYPRCWGSKAAQDPSTAYRPASFMQCGIRTRKTKNIPGPKHHVMKAYRGHEIKSTMWYRIGTSWSYMLRLL
jgi:hypothetical protein